MKRFNVALTCLCLLVCTPRLLEATTYYVDSAGGNDANTGQSSTAPWKTIAKVNSVALSPGDSVLFKRGSIWRESLANSSAGATGSAITYADYGTGSKPSIRGSDIYSNPNLWVNESGNLWYVPKLWMDPGVFVHDGVLGARKLAKSSLTSQWDYWYDAVNYRLYIFYTSNPATAASLLEIATRSGFVLSQTWGYITYRNLDLRHFRGSAVWCGTGDINVSFLAVDVAQVAGHGFQFKNGSSGKVANSSFTDWGVVDGYQYAVLANHTSGGTTGPVDVTDSVFTINHRLNHTYLSAIVNDVGGWIRNIARNVVRSNGKWPGTMALSWKLGAAATSVTIEDNQFYGPGNCGIIVQDLEVNGAHPTVAVQRNLISNADQGDVAGTEALRLRGFTTASNVTARYNLIWQTRSGSNSHPGIWAYQASGVKIFNNTVYGADDGVLMSGSTIGADVHNNIVAFNRGYGFNLEPGSTISNPDYDLVYSNARGNYQGLAQGAHDIVASPQFLNGASGDLRLQTSSPAIDRGLNLGSPNNLGISPASPLPGAYLDQNGFGSGWEIGAFIYVPAAETRTLTIITSSVPNGQVQVPYQATLQAQGGISPYTWSVSSGSLPPGLTLNASTGSITGTPTQVVTSSIIIQVKDSSPVGQKATKNFQIVIAAKLTITSSSLPNGQVQVPYQFTVQAQGGISPYKWSVSSGSLPPGLNINASTGSISGSPSQAGTFSFTVQVVDSSQPTNQKATKSFQVTITSASGGGLSIVTTLLPDGALLTAYLGTLVAQGGTPPYAWSLTSGSLPPGLSLTASTGVISGTPTLVGSFTFTIQVTDSSQPTHQTAAKIFTVAVTGGLQVLTNSLYPAELGEAYAAVLIAAGGVAPYKWSIVSGVLPSGLSLDATSGKITGTPTASGTAALTIQVQDSSTSTTHSATTKTFTPVIVTGQSNK